MNPGWELRLVDDAGMLEVRHKVSSPDSGHLHCVGVTRLLVSPLHCTAFPDTELYVKVLAKGLQTTLCQMFQQAGQACFTCLSASKVQHASEHASLHCQLLADQCGLPAVHTVGLQSNNQRCFLSCGPHLPCLQDMIPLYPHPAAWNTVEMLPARCGKLTPSLRLMLLSRRHCLQDMSDAAPNMLHV